jgi:hypothetical protein
MSYSPFSYTVAKKCHHEVIHDIQKWNCTNHIKDTDKLNKTIKSYFCFQISNNIKVQSPNKLKTTIIAVSKIPSSYTIREHIHHFLNKNKKIHFLYHSSDELKKMIKSSTVSNILFVYTYIILFYLFPICISQIKQTKKKQLSLISVYKNSLLTHLCLNIHHFSFIYSQFVYHSSEKL